MAGFREVSWRSEPVNREQNEEPGRPGRQRHHKRTKNQHGHGELSKPRTPVVCVDLEGLVVACGVLAQAMRVKFQKHLFFLFNYR